MSRKYYLDGGVEYQPDSGELLVNGRIENLQSLENKLLLHFVLNPNELINKEELYEVGWDNRIHGDNPLSKAISNIRSKLNDSPKNPQYIKTIPKKGFRFISSVSEHPAASNTSAVKTAGAQQAGTIAKIIALLLLSVAIIYFTADNLLLSDNNLSPQKISDFKRITHSQGQERHPHLSFDGNTIVFSRRQDSDSLSQLYLKPLPGGEEKQLTGNNFDNLSPKWHKDGKRILYHRFNTEQCEIAMIEMDERYNVVNDKMLMTCGKFSRRLGLSWGPDNSIYYTDIDIQFAAQKIYKLDLKSGKRTVISEPPESDSAGRGYYRVHYDPVSNQLYALLSVEWYATDVVTLNLEGEMLNRHRVNLALFSISSYNGMPVFRSADNHVRYLEQGENHLLMQSPLWPIFSPQLTEGQQPGLAFVGGVLNNSQLVQLNLIDNSETPLTDTKVAHRLPVMSAQNNLYYVSNESGITQAWRQTDGEPEKLSQFLEDKYIGGLAVSDDERYLALYIGQDIHVYQLNNLPLRHAQPYIELQNAVNPHFSPDGKNLWFSRKEDNTYYLTSVNLNDKKLEDAKFEHGYLGLFDHHNGQHMVFKYEQPGAWQIQDNELKWYANAPLLSSHQNTVLENGLLTYFDDANTQLVQLELQSGKRKILTEKESFRYITKRRGQTEQWIVARRRFGNTDIYITKY